MYECTKACVCVCAWGHVHVCVQRHMYMCWYPRACVHRNMRICVCTSVCIYRDTHACACALGCVSTRTCVYVRVYRGVCLQGHTCMYMCTWTRVYRDTCAGACAPGCVRTLPPLPPALAAARRRTHLCWAHTPPGPRRRSGTRLTPPASRPCSGGGKEGEVSRGAPRCSGTLPHCPNPCSSRCPRIGPGSGPPEGAALWGGSQQGALCLEGP